MSLLNFPYKFFSRNILLIFISLFSLAFFASVWHRYAYIDDCWFAEQAYWLAKSGIVKTPSIMADLGWENRLMVYHKLNIWLGALIIKYLGWSIYYLKAITLFALAFFVFILKRYLHNIQYLYPPLAFPLAILVFIANPLVLIYGFTYRPEILVMTLGFASFLALERIRSGQGNIHAWALLAGFLAGVSLLTHLNGITFIASGGLYLLITRKFKAIPAFTISSMVVVVLYIIDLLPAGNLHLFLQQMRDWPDAISGNYISGNSLFTRILLKLGNEHQRFFWSDRASIFSSFFIFSLIASFRYLYFNHKHLLIYTGFLILFLNLLGSQIAERYLLYYSPFMSLIITFSILHLIIHRKRFWLTAFMLIMLLQAGVWVKHWTEIMKMNSAFTVTNHELAALIPDGPGKILAPYHFIFNEIGSRPILTYHSLEYYETRTKSKLSGKEALQRCKTLGVKYIIIDKGLENDTEKYRWFEMAIEQKDSNYTVFKRYKGFVVLRSLDEVGVDNIFNLINQ
jgi:hypothetical protein